MAAMREGKRTNNTPTTFSAVPSVFMTPDCSCQASSTVLFFLASSPSYCLLSSGDAFTSFIINPLTLSLGLRPGSANSGKRAQQPARGWDPSHAGHIIAVFLGLVL